MFESQFALMTGGGQAAKLSNEAVKCCERDASRLTDCNIGIVGWRRHNILVLAQESNPEPWD
jgi:hypothetical protein